MVTGIVARTSPWLYNQVTRALIRALSWRRVCPRFLVQEGRVLVLRPHISRPRLLQRLSLAIGCRLTLVCANAGYGKTTLLQEFCSKASFPAEWYHLTSGDRDVTLLSKGLEGCLRRLASQSKTAASDGVVANDAAPVDMPEHSFGPLREAGHLGPSPVLLVLEDYHRLDGAPDVRPLLTSLLEMSPPSLRLVILSRTVPDLPLASLTARQELFALGEDDLAFSQAETSEFLRGDGSSSLDDTTLTLAYERTEGWPAGIAMMLQTVRHGRQDTMKELLANPATSVWLVYDYLAEEVFDRQDQETKEFLVKTSILDNMSAAACDRLLNSACSHVVLLAMEEKGLFTISVDSSKHYFRYHQLFRAFLRQKLEQCHTRDTIAGLHQVAGEFYEAEGAWDDCIRHYLAGAAAGRAVQVVESVGQQLIFSGSFWTVEQWLRSIPSELATTRPWLVALRGQIGHMSGSSDTALLLLERALHLFQAERDKKGQAWVMGEIASLRLKRREADLAMAQLDKAFEVVPHDPALKSQLQVTQSVAYREVGMLAESLAACSAATDELAGIDDEALRLRIRSRIARSLARTNMEMGRVQESRRILHDALTMCVTHRLEKGDQSWLLLEQGIAYWAGGDFANAIEALQRSLALCDQYAKHQENFVALWLGNSLRDSGRYSDAEEVYRRSDYHVVQLERLFLALLLGRAQSVKRWAMELYSECMSSETVRNRGSAEVVLGIVLRDCHELSEGLEHVRQGVSLLSAHGYRLRLASALFHQAHIEFLLSRQEEGMESLRRAFKLSAEGEFFHFFWSDHRVIASSCQRALTSNALSVYAAGLESRSLARVDGGRRLPLQSDGREKAGNDYKSILPPSPSSAMDLSQYSVLSDCTAPESRRLLSRAINDGILSSEDLRLLRSRTHLTWREIEVLVEYYLRPATQPSAAEVSLRKDCAQRLFISENTLRCHVNSIRGKLAFPPSLMGKRVLAWVAEKGVLPSTDELL